MNEREQTERTALTGVITCGLGLILNIISVILANSLVLVADFFNSLLEFTSITLTWLTLRALRKDNRAIFNYGLGKIENISSLFIGMFMLISILIMTFLIVNRLRQPAWIEGFGIWIGIVCTLVFGTVNGILWIKSRRHNKEAPSPIVDAQCRLFAVKTISNTCMFLTFSLSVGFRGRYPWMMYLDPLASCITVGFLIHGVWTLIQHSIHDLLDRSLGEPIQILINRQLAQHFEEYTSLDGVRSRYSGRNVFIEIFLGFAPERSIGAIQKTSDAIKQSLEKELPYSEVLVIPRAQ